MSIENVPTYLFLTGWLSEGAKVVRGGIKQERHTLVCRVLQPRLTFLSKMFCPEEVIPLLSGHWMSG